MITIKIIDEFGRKDTFYIHYTQVRAVVIPFMRRLDNKKINYKIYM